MSEQPKFSVPSATEMLTLFGATALAIGYLYEVGFVAGFDSRLLQFLSIADYLAASTSYVFVGFAAICTFGAQWFIFMSDGRAGILYEIGTLYATDGEPNPILAEKLRRIVRWLLLIVVALGVFTVATRWADWRWFGAKYWYDDAFTSLQLVFFPGLVLTIIPESLRNIRTARARQYFTAAAGGFFVLAASYFYGQHQGTLVGLRDKTNFAFEMVDGHHVDAVLLQRFSAGVAYQFVGEKRIYFVPENQIKSLVLH